VGYNQKELQDIVDVHAQELSEYNYYGVRVCDDELETGSTPPNSYRWEDNSPTDEEMKGACCADLSDGVTDGLVKIVSSYFGDHAYIIAGNASMYGDDSMELIVEDAVVICEVPRCTSPTRQHDHR